MIANYEKAMLISLRRIYFLRTISTHASAGDLRNRTAGIRPKEASRTRQRHRRRYPWLQVSHERKKRREDGQRRPTKIKRTPGAPETPRRQTAPKTISERDLNVKEVL